MDECYIVLSNASTGTGMQIPQAAAAVLNQAPAVTPSPLAAIPPIATQCFMLSAMFDARTR